jgi:hypothetical protein
MSLGEFIAALAANFIVAGIVWQLKGANAGLICLSVGFVLAAIAFLLRKKRPEPPQSPISIHLENIGNPTQSSEQRILVPPVLPQPAETKKSDIKFLRSEESALSDFHQYAPALSVVAACLRNDSAHDTRYDFAAHIIYKNANGDQVSDTGRGLWLSTSSTTTRFPTGITRQLAIFLFANDRELLKPIPNRRTETLAGKPIVIPDITAEKFKEKIATVEIRLLRERTEPIIFNFTVQTIDGKTTLLPQEGEKP